LKRSSLDKISVFLNEFNYYTLYYFVNNDIYAYEMVHQKSTKSADRLYVNLFILMIFLKS